MLARHLRHFAGENSWATLLRINTAVIPGERSEVKGTQVAKAITVFRACDETVRNVEHR